MSYRMSVMFGLLQVISYVLAVPILCLEMPLLLLGFVIGLVTNFHPSQLRLAVTQRVVGYIPFQRRCYRGAVMLGLR